MITKLLDPIFMPIVSPIKNIIDAIVKIIELIILLVTKIPEILMMAFEIFNPINIINDSITGSILAIKVVIVGLIDTFSSPSFNSTYSKCKDTGSGLFGYRREKDSSGKIVKNSCGDGKICKRNFCKIYNYCIMSSISIIVTSWNERIFPRFDMWILNCVYVLFPRINICIITHY